MADAADRAVIDAVGAIAETRGVSRATVALAWHFAKPGITAPIVGASKPHHLEAAVAALELGLTDEEVKALEGPYRPKATAGFGAPMPTMDKVSVLGD